MSLANADPIYSREQIIIPSAFPDILKDYSKHIIRTQPKDIIGASAEYFATLARQQSLGRQVHVSGISREQLETMYIKFHGKPPKLAREAINKIAEESLVSTQTVEEVFHVGTWPDGVAVNWADFWALCCTVAAGTLQATLLLIVDILASNGSVPSGPLSNAVQFLAKTEGSVSSDRVALCAAEMTMDGCVLILV
ncbi:hypothetical protein BCR44DRAFT_118195, partial [Catenaria anguillulae PL171]